MIPQLPQAPCLSSIVIGRGHRLQQLLWASRVFYWYGPAGLMYTNVSRPQQLRRVSRHNLSLGRLAMIRNTRGNVYGDPGHRTIPHLGIDQISQIASAPRDDPLFEYGWEGPCLGRMLCKIARPGYVESRL
jgi:hypothetical protein